MIPSGKSFIQSAPAVLQVPAEHVISASFMSAPAALAIAKISIPETQVSKIRTQKEIHLPAGYNKCRFSI